MPNSLAYISAYTPAEAAVMLCQAVDFGASADLIAALTKRAHEAMPKIQGKARSDETRARLEAMDEEWRQRDVVELQCVECAKSQTSPRCAVIMGKAGVLRPACSCGGGLRETKRSGVENPRQFVRLPLHAGASSPPVLSAREGA